MTSFNRKNSLIERLVNQTYLSDDNQSNSEQRSSLAVSDDVPDCYNQVRYIPDSCKVLCNLWKIDKDFLNKSIDNDVSKSLKEFRLSDVARCYRSPYRINGVLSILNQTIDDLIRIHDFIDSKRKEWLEQF
ncbi:unnamed protein product [Rotaria sordida]|uniref:Uncharacterized protein n=1 Tax=Rotaria sordida TaxID=392033 RepID=A0A814LT62_9BILA|nr:unnamed protein product [Rotaria sordida]CAF1260403.1 unnamed protein product [Rotaria sordida]